MAFLLGTIAIVVIAFRLRSLQRELTELRQEVDGLRRRLDPARAQAASATAAPAVTPVVETVRPRAVDAAPAAAVPVAPRAETPRAPVSAPPPPKSPAAAAAPPPTSQPAPKVAAAAAFQASATSAPPGAAAGTVSPKHGGVDLETRVGTTWALRVGLGAIAVAAALFARTIVPNLSPPAKVALAYAGALALVAIGRFFEHRLARWGRPVMAGGLAIGFFVSYAAHFVPAMQTVPLLPALLWMAAGVIAILAVANRWRSEPTAGLAIVLGHLAAFVAAGNADLYSLVIILFLSAAAVYLLWRHDWLPLSLVAVGAAYASHLLWGLADRAAVAPGRAVLLSILFLSSYYVVFLAADLFWWRRRSASPDAVQHAKLARVLGPVNLVLYASSAAFVYFAAGQPGSLTTFLFSVGALQLALTLAYRQLRNVDWALYPALGTIFVTLGFISALDALSLDVVLAMEALVLLIAAQRTRLRVFHVLAQAVLATNFLHYAFNPGSTVASLGQYLGGMAITLAYFAQALLEQHWYRRDHWSAAEAPTGLTGWIAQQFDRAFRVIAPYFAHLHAVGGALILLRETFRFLPGGDATPALLTVVTLLALAAVMLRSTPLLLAYGITHLGAAGATIAAASNWTWETLAVAALLLALPTGLLREARRYHPPAQLAIIAFITLATIASGMIVLAQTSTDIDSLGYYLGWIGVAALIYVHADRARVTSEDHILIRTFAATLGLTAAIAIAGATSELTGDTFTAVNGAWISVWAALLLAAAFWRRDVGFYLAGSLLVVIAAVLSIDDAATTAVANVLLIAAVPLALALVQDHLGAERALGKGEAQLLGSTWTAYLIATGLLWSLLEARVPSPWQIAAVAALPVALHVAGARARTGAARSFATVLMFGVLFREAMSLQQPIVGAEDAGRLIAALLVVAAALVLERIMIARGDTDSILPLKYVATAHVAGAAIVAILAFERTSWTGGTFATIGFSLVGAALMTIGFAARSARHRRIALGVFALTLARAFIIDARGLSDTGRTLAFLVLGLSLVAVAWLYSRFAARIREWL